MQDSSFYSRVIECAREAVRMDITPTLCAVTIDFNKKSLLLRGYFETSATDDDKEELNHALTVIASILWKEIREFYFEAVEIESQINIKCLKEWVYLRPGLQITAPNK